jgi:hypothetical protein
MSANDQAKLETIRRAESIVRATHGADDLADDLYALGLELGRDTTYNGWGNYPTWCVNLWLSNEESLYNEARELVSAPVDLLGSESSLVYVEPDRRRRIAAAERLKSWVRDDLAPDLGASFAADLLGYALDDVDWFELADAWLEDAPQRFVVVEYTPGYLPEDDDPLVTDDYAAAVEYLNDRAAEYADDPDGSFTVEYGIASGDNYAAVIVHDSTKTHDLGRVIEILNAENDS